MRTTIDLPNPLFRKLKAVAALQGTSLKQIIQSSVESEVRKFETKKVQKLKFPLLSSKEPGSLNLTNAEIEDLLT